MKKKKIYVKSITSKVGNNQSTCEVKNNKESEIIKYDNKTVEEKLNELFNTNGYIFNINVKIITDNMTYDTKIASRVGDNLITLDNDIIGISDIKDITF